MEHLLLFFLVIFTNINFNLFWFLSQLEAIQVKINNYSSNKNNITVTNVTH